MPTTVHSVDVVFVIWFLSTLSRYVCLSTVLYFDDLEGGPKTTALPSIDQRARIQDMDVGA